MSEGRYIYCIINRGVETTLGKIGIEDSEVYTVPHKDISAVVHNCLAKPYDTKDEEKAREWLLAHLYVVDVAMKKYGTVAPFGFDTIIKDDEERVKAWLREEYARLKSVLSRVEDKAEYGVQVFWDCSRIARGVEEADEEIKRIKEEIETKPNGVAYMLKRKSEKLLEKKLAEEAEKYRKNFYRQISKHAEEVKLDETNKSVPEKRPDKQMLFSLACLVHEDKVEKLGEALEKINEMEGFDVRFTGPWAPFNFVGGEK